MPPRASLLLAGALGAFVIACTNDYEDFRFPRKPVESAGPGEDGQAAPLANEPTNDAGAVADAALDVTNGREAP